MQETQTVQSTDKTSLDSLESSFRESMLEHVFISELLQEAWVNRRETVEVLRSEVDASGYDLVLEHRGVLRHVQLKGSKSKAKTANQRVNVKLTDKPSGCVVWIFYSEDQDNGRIQLSYMFFGNGPHKKLPSLEQFRVGKHSKGDSKGFKAERPNTRVIPKSQFVKVGTTRELMTLLFGTSEAD